MSEKVASDERFARAVSEGRINSYTENSIRKVVGAFLSIATLLAMMVSPAFRKEYSWATTFLSSGLCVWATGILSL